MKPWISVVCNEAAKIAGVKDKNKAVSRWIKNTGHAKRSHRERLGRDVAIYLACVELELSKAEVAKAFNVHIANVGRRLGAVEELREQIVFDLSVEKAENHLRKIKEILK